MSKALQKSRQKTSTALPKALSKAANQICPFSLFLGAFYVTSVKYTPALYSVAMNNQKIT